MAGHIVASLAAQTTKLETTAEGSNFLAFQGMKINVWHGPPVSNALGQTELPGNQHLPQSSAKFVLSRHYN